MNSFLDDMSEIKISLEICMTSLMTSQLRNVSVHSQHTWSSCHAMNGQVLQYIDLQLQHANRNRDKMLQKFCYNLNTTDRPNTINNKTLKYIWWVIKMNHHLSHFLLPSTQYGFSFCQWNIPSRNGFPQAAQTKHCMCHVWFNACITS